MNKPRLQERIHSLEIPIGRWSLLVPSASVAEVVTASDLKPLPGSPAWVAGVLAWRLYGLPVISFEALAGGKRTALTSVAKIVVFYPLTGRREWEFFGIVAESEPRPQPVDAATAIAAQPTELPDTPYIAAGLKTEGRLLLIPDLDALRASFYP